jgi:hypothetical protein
MKKNKWALSDIEAIVTIVGIALTIGINYFILETKVNNLSCEFVEFKIVHKKIKKLDYTSGVNANHTTKTLDKDALEYWKHIQEQIIRLSEDINSLEETREKEC